VTQPSIKENLLSYNVEEFREQPSKARLECEEKVVRPEDLLIQTQMNQVYGVLDQHRKLPRESDVENLDVKQLKNFK